MVNREQRANSQTPVDVRSAKAGQRSHRRFGVGRESCRPPKDGSRVALPDSLVENGIGLVGGNERSTLNSEPTPRRLWMSGLLKSGQVLTGHSGWAGKVAGHQRTVGG